MQSNLNSCLAAAFLFTALSAALPVHAAPTAVPPAPEQSPFAVTKRAALINSFGRPALTYLESLKGRELYRAPSEIDPRYTIAFYINASAKGPNAQRMWILQRDKIGGAWKLAMWDERLWADKGLPSGVTPPYSWPVSTGKKYPGDAKSGPTPVGVFSIDERKWRMARGYTIPGMINVIYIDLHYSSGRRSGVAFHGTTRSLYRLLGRIDSHGCIRMTQPNALALINRLQGRDGVLSDEMRWGAVPRFWKYERRGNRYGYTRDGTPHAVIPEAQRTAANLNASLSDVIPLPDVLTKTGYRAITVMFRD